MRDRNREAGRRDLLPDEKIPREPIDLSRRQQELHEVVARLRNSDIDVRDYMPDLDTILREAHPARRAAKLQEALDLERDVTLRQSLSDIATLRSEADPVRLERKLHAVIAKARGSEVELGEYLPDLEASIREVDPARRAKKLRDALDNPQLDHVLAGACSSLARLDRVTVDRGSAASAWAQQQDDVTPIDKAALPSAMMPFAPAPDRAAAAPQHATTLEKAPTPANARPSWRWSVAKSVMAVIAVVAPLTMMYFLLVWQKDHGPRGASPAAISATTAPPLLPSAASVPSTAPSSLPNSEPTQGPLPAASVKASSGSASALAPHVDASATTPLSTTPRLPQRGPRQPRTTPPSRSSASAPLSPPDQDPGMNE